MPLKFRVWDTEEKRLVYDAELVYDYLYPAENPLCVYSFHELIEDERYIISQDTGLKDKNGKSIYTGDLVQFEDWSLGVCYWSTIGAAVDFHSIKGSDNIEGFIEQYKIVGNIWQNKELLEGTE